MLYTYITEHRKKARIESSLSKKEFSELRVIIIDIKHSIAPVGIISISTGQRNQGCKSAKNNNNIPTQSKNQATVFLLIDIVTISYA